MTYNADSAFPRMLRTLMQGGTTDHRRNNAYKYPDIAKAVGVNEATIWRWSTGKNAPKLTDLYKLAELFEVPVWALIEPLSEEPLTSEEEMRIRILRALAKRGE